MNLTAFAALTCIQTSTVSGKEKSTSETRTEKFKERETRSMERKVGVHVKKTEYCLAGTLEESWPLATTAPVCKSTSCVLLTTKFDVGWNMDTVSVSVCKKPQSGIVNTVGPVMDATGNAKTNTDVALPDLMTVEPVCVMTLKTVFPAPGKAGA